MELCTCSKCTQYNHNNLVNKIQPDNPNISILKQGFGSIIRSLNWGAQSNSALRKACASMTIPLKEICKSLFSKDDKIIRKTIQTVSQKSAPISPILKQPPAHPNLQLFITEISDSNSDGCDDKILQLTLSSTIIPAGFFNCPHKDEATQLFKIQNDLNTDKS